MSNIENVALHCLADETYYGGLHCLKDEASRFPLADADLPSGWERSGTGLWTALRPTGAKLPQQGWKIHLSAIPEDAEPTLETAARICWTAASRSSSCAARGR